MSEPRQAPPDLARHLIAELMMGGAVALVAITVAHASLPEIIHSLPVTATRATPTVTAAVAARRAPPPPVLIAFAAPLPDGEVGSPFGLRQLPWEGQARLHAGVDMVAPEPEPVLAAADGVVTRIGEDPGYGRFVELTHAEGLTSLYGHLERFAPGMATGVALKAGTAVGRLGSTGTSTGVHLHFEIHDAQGRPMNPEVFLGHSFAEARDLPLREARRVPRRVRVAFVSHIPRSKRAEMQARLDDDAAQAAEDAEEGTEPAADNRTHRSHGRVRSHLRLYSRG